MNHDFWQYLANLAAFATIAGFAFNHMRGRRADKKDMEASRKADQKEMQTERENLITWRGAVDSKLKQGRREARRLRRRDGRIFKSITRLQGDFHSVQGDLREFMAEMRTQRSKGKSRRRA